MFDTASVAVLDLPWEKARHRRIATLSGGQQKRFALELLLRGPDEVLLLDEPDNFLDVPGKRWLETRLRESAKSVLYVCHDRELLARTADQVVTVEGGSAWTHPGASRPGTRRGWPGTTASTSCAGAGTRRPEAASAWSSMYKQKAAYNDGLASRLPGRADPAGEVRGGRAAAGDGRRSRTSGCGSAAGAPASARWSASSWSSTT